MLKASYAAFMAAERKAYSLARANLRRGIFRAKHCYTQRIEKHFNSSDPLTITDVKPPSTAPPTSSASLLDELNEFYARFDQGNKEVILKANLPPDEQPFILSTSDVCSTLSKMNAAGPDGITGHLLRASALQGVNGYFKPVPGPSSCPY